MKKFLLLIALPLISISSIIGQTSSLIPTGASWKYLANGTNQGTAWRATSFNDATWSTGNAELGYGDGGEATIVSYGPSAFNKYITTYFRKSFTVTNPAAYTSLTLSLLRDDGAVVYLNGTQVAKSNMPSGTINYTTKASSNINGSGETTYYNFTPALSLLVSGTNVIAVEIHQVTKSNADISFNLSLTGTLAVTCGIPSSLASAAINSTGASLSWGAVSGATSYNLRYRLSGSTTWVTVSNSTTSKLITGLSSGSIYEYSVQAICATGSGSYSANSTFSTLTSGNDTLITTFSSWKYLDNGTNQGTAWMTPLFNDASWLTGNAELGYGDGDEATVVGYGPNSATKYITTYFRKSFNVINPAIYAALNLSVVRDDGIVVYINGVEVYRNNMPTGTIAYNTLAPVAAASTDESTWYNTTLNTSSLIAGNNVIAVEIHQQALTSSDISFKARLWGSGTAPLPIVTRGAYLQKLTPSSITIRWRTNIACDSKVQFGTSINYSASVSDANQTTEHIVTLTGLNPNTKYFYSVGTTSASLQGDSKNNFYTAPLSGTAVPARIWVTGDFGNGSTQQTAVRDAYATYTGTTPTNLWLWLGDNAYATGTDAEYQSYVFSKYPDQLKSIPLYPSPGNHDYGNAGYQTTNTLTTNFPYFSNFSLPQSAEAGGVASNTPKYYSYNYSNIHFISLDSYGSYNNSTSAMYNWLSSDLAANTQRWTVVYFHHPPYTKGTHNSDTDTELINMRSNIIPLLENYHVDLVLCGHSHVNERSYMIKGHYGTSTTFTQAMKISTATNVFSKTAPFDGTVYATCGTSGQNPGTVQSGYPMPCMYFNNNTNNCSLVMDVNGDNLSCKYLASTGAIVDQFSITKTGARETSPAKPKIVQINNNIDENSVLIDVYLEKESEVSIEYLAINGQTAYKFSDLSGKLSTGFHRLEFENPSIASGIYILKITVDQHQFFDKILIP